MKKVLFVIALSTILSGCINDPTASEALCLAQEQDATAVCTDTETDTGTDTSFFTDEEVKEIEEAVDETSSTDSDTGTVVE